MRVWLHVARRIVSDAFKLIAQFAVVITVVGAIITLAIMYESFAGFIGWTLFGLMSFLILTLITVYVLGVHDDVKRKLK